ncbi:MAG: hypothetical protein M1835_004256 [Candelina submexicana]|nr:MAG: hypothetical protein M1835_004256 [Candelina submexicana]
MAASREPGVELAPPDIMNDPAYDTNGGTGEQSTDEQSACRICRSEGTPKEPLFYPCRCSGSIKYVHQDCLMEWLSHSQKKHCELCKTPFRFTKLYHPQMPQSLPTLVFLRHAVTNSFRSLLSWFRGLLVSFVWLGWLPWAMRIFWRALFWLGDGGWASWHDASILDGSMAQNASVADRSVTAVSIGDSQAISEATTSFTRETSQFPAASVAGATLSSILYPFSQTLNLSTEEPIAHSLVKRFFFGFSSGSVSAHSRAILNSTVTPNGTDAFINSQEHPSWLSNVGFLRNLTRSPKTNSLIIDIFEGQLITLCVVVAFILIFLIREWVVQQQPGINIQAGPMLDPPARQPEEDGALVLLARQHAQQRLERFRAQNANPVAQENEYNEGEGVARAQSNTDHAPARFDPADVATQLLEGQISMPRPNIARNALDRALTVQLIASEDKKGARCWSTFIEIWQRSGGDPQEALKLIREDAASETTTWMIEVVHRLMEIEASEHQLIPKSPLSRREDGEIDHLSDNSSGSWQDVLNADLGDQIVTNTDSPGTPAVPTADENEGGASTHKSSQKFQTNASGGMRDGEPVPQGVQMPLDKGKGRAIEADDSDQLKQTAVPPLQYGPSIAAHSDFDVVNGVKPNLRASPGSHLGSPIKASHQDILTDVDSRSERSINEAGGRDTQGSSQRRSSLNSNHHTVSAAATDNPFHPRFGGDLPEQSLLPTSIPQVEGNIANAGATAEHQVANTAALAPPLPRNLIERVMDWLYEGVVPTAIGQNEIQLNDEHIVQDLAAEAPFVPVAHAVADNAGEPNEAGNVAHDREVAAAGAGAALDPEEPEVVDEVEDFEGVMELIGMRGPLLGLVQNGVFSAVLIMSTVTGGVWIPYCWGKFVLLVMGDPILYLVKLPLLVVSAAADLMVDLSLLAISSVTWWANNSFSWALAPLCWIFPFVMKYTHSPTVAATTGSVIDASLERIAKALVSTSDNFSTTDYRIFSILSHEALQLTQSRTAEVFRISFRLLMATGEGLHSLASRPWASGSSYDDKFAKSVLLMTDICRTGLDKVYGVARLAPSLVKPNILWLSLDIPRRTTPIDLELAYWGTNDRFVAVVAGYTFFALLGALYLKKGSPFSTSENGKKLEGFIVEVLQQAGGVLKVILIISIEMIAFPLYCGLLLDFALLPLFESATLMSRLSFTATSPWTSAFVHWFVGTCYMFHFALFVSMCRKIMRSGVLYFIRDPDDPTFHPVREVLERNVSTQLRKITFSALVYGALVVVCFGGVVWGLFYTFDGVLPIHWSSNEPVLEFPVDLLFYNFLTPLAVKLYKPSDGLHTIYHWWFRKCARSLRLTHFLFGEKHDDEEGHHVRRTWWSLIVRKMGDISRPVIGEDRKLLVEDRDIDVYFLRDGRYVRAPASDQVRIPKGGHVFLEVNERNERVGGQRDPDDGFHSNNTDLYTKVYIPPWFRLRISLFVLAIWVFAAATGVGVTIVPLVLGRMIFATIIPHHLRMNDVYAFSIGIYILGGLLYTALNFKNSIVYLKATLAPHPAALRQALSDLYAPALRVLHVLYVYSAFTLLLPSLLACLMEAYLIIPLHTYLVPGEQHIVHFVQDWTLGVLYLKISGRFLLWHNNSRPAYALRAIVRNGWSNPDAAIATRCFVTPALMLASLAFGLPLVLGWIANHTVFAGLHPELQARIYRFCYPAVAVVLLGMVLGWGMSFCLTSWRLRIRDEAYLIGERLHNFGERKARVEPVVSEPKVLGEVRVDTEESGHA